MIIIEKQSKRPSYLKDETGYPLHYHKLYTRLGLSNTSHLPAEGLAVQNVGGVQVYILSKEEAKLQASLLKRRFIHRVIAICPDCNKHIPAGKLQQHIRVHFKKG